MQNIQFCFCKKNLYRGETVQMQEMQAGIFLQKKNTNNLFQYEEAKRKKQKMKETF